MFFETNSSRSADALSSSIHGGWFQCSGGIRPNWTDEFVTCDIALSSNAFDYITFGTWGRLRSEFFVEWLIIQKYIWISKFLIESIFQSLHAVYGPLQIYVPSWRIIVSQLYIIKIHAYWAWRWLRWPCVEYFHPSYTSHRDRVRSRALEVPRIGSPETKRLAAHVFHVPYRTMGERTTRS